jgi:hypothetical protein
MAFGETCHSTFDRIFFAVLRASSIFLLNTPGKLDFLIIQEILASRNFYTWKSKIHIRGKNPGTSLCIAEIRMLSMITTTLISSTCFLSVQNETHSTYVA